MKLAVVNLTGGGLSGGYRKYLECLAPLLGRHPTIDQLAIFVPPGMETSLKIQDTPLFSWPVGDRIRGYPWLKQKISALSPAVVFIPTARCLDFGRIPVVNMVRNMEPLEVPFNGNPVPEMIRNIFRRYAARKATQKAARVIAVSRHVQEFLLSHWQLDPRKVGVVYHGIDGPSDPAAKAGEGPGTGEFLFTAGSIRPARGLEDIIGALGRMKKSGRRCRLVIAGSLDAGMQSYRKKIDDLIREYDLLSQITWAGSLTQEDMSYYYRRCRLFVMTSRAEACPNIALEAMAHGCVSVSTDTPPMPEMFGEAAVYYPAKEASRLAEKIGEVLAWEDRRRAGMSEQARERARSFSWRLCMEQTAGELHKAADSFVERPEK